MSKLRPYFIEVERVITQRQTMRVHATNKGAAVANALHEATLPEHENEWVNAYATKSSPRLAKKS